MKRNILAQKRQKGRGILPQAPLSLKYLTAVVAACCIGAPYPSEAQTAVTPSDQTISELINVGEQNVNKEISGDTKFYSPDHSVGVWVNGGSFTDDAGGSQQHTYVLSPTIFQIGGETLYNGTIPQSTVENNHGGSIRLNQLVTRNDGTRPDLSIILLGSGDAPAVFSTESFSAADSPDRTITLYIDGLNSNNETAFKSDSLFNLQRDQGATGGSIAFTLKNSASFSAGQNAYFALTDPSDLFVVKDAKEMSVVGNLYIYNSASPITDLTQESEQAIIKNTDVNVKGDFALVGGLGYKVGNSTFLQIVNDSGSNAALSASTVLVYSDQPDNTTTLLLGKGAKINADKYVFVYSGASSHSQLLVGDTSSNEDDYGITTPFVSMGGKGSSEIIFNNAHSGDSAETASFVISGRGTVSVRSGRTVFSKASTYRGQTNIAANSSLILKTISSAGTSSITNEGELIFSGANGPIQNEITGSGAVIFDDGSSVSVLKNANWTGPTELKEASVAMGTDDNPVRLASSSVTISREGSLQGFGSMTGSLTNGGLFMLGDSDNASPTAFNVGGDVTNSGKIVLGNGKSAGNSLIVGGNYTGSNGLMVFNTILNGDSDSPTDKLIVKGDTAGNTRVQVNTLGGAGKQTNNGIELISVGGASNGTFTQEGRIVAGAYDYNLERGTGADSKNWYLKSHLTQSKGPHGRINTGDDPIDPHDQTFDPREDEIPLVRPEVSAYIGNNAVVHTLFSSRLHDRIGDLWYADPHAENNQLTGTWIKQRGNYNSWRESSGQTRNRTTMFATQIGSDVASWTLNGANRFLVGWVAGYGHGRTKSRSIHSGYHAIGTVDGFNVGLTATWYQDGLSHEGLYVDSWLTYGWFNNKVKGEGLKTEKYHSRGFSGSLETGYTLKLSEFLTDGGCDVGLYLQPQAQVIWSGVKTETFHEANGTAVKSKGRNNIQTRLGTRALLDMYVSSYVKGVGGTQLFIEGNWVHNTKSNGVEMDGTVLNQKGARNLGELKLGLNSKFTRHLHLWTNATVRAGTNHYRDLTGMIGVKYSF